MKRREVYDKEFRDEAVKLAITGDKTIIETAYDLGINDSTLYNWVTKAKKSKALIKDGNTVRKSGDLVNELNQLRRENARLKEEREILKKAAAFFAKEEQKR